MASVDLVDWTVIEFVCACVIAVQWARLGHGRVDLGLCSEPEVASLGLLSLWRPPFVLKQQTHGAAWRAGWWRRVFWCHDFLCRPHLQQKQAALLHSWCLMLQGVEMVPLGFSVDVLPLSVPS